MAEQKLKPGDKSNSLSEFCLLADGEVEFGRTVEIRERVDLSVVVEEIKIKLRNSSQLQREGNAF